MRARGGRKCSLNDNTSGVGCFWRAVCECLRASESLRIATAGSHAVLELCCVAVSAYGSPLCMAFHAMGNTDAGGGYYCGVSERANACVCARAALFASCVSHAMPRVALCRDKMLLGRHRARVSLCRGTAPRVYACRCTDRRVSRGAVSACCSAETVPCRQRRVKVLRLRCTRILACKRGAVLCCIG